MNSVRDLVARLLEPDIDPDALVVNLDRIKEEWLSYCELIIPKSATVVQLRESRRAFYAGARAVMKRLHELDSVEISEREGARRLQLIDREIELFLDRMGTELEGA